MPDRMFSIAIIGPRETHDVSRSVATMLQSLGHSVDLPPELQGVRLDGKITEVERLLAERLERNDVIVLIDSAAITKSPWVHSERATAAAAGRQVVAVKAERWRLLNQYKQRQYIAEELRKLKDPHIPDDLIPARAALNSTIRSEIQRLATETTPFDGSAKRAIDYLLAHATVAEHNAIDKARSVAYEVAYERGLDAGESGVMTPFTGGDPDYEVLQRIWSTVKGWSPPKRRVSPSGGLSDLEMIDSIRHHPQRNSYLADRYCRSNGNGIATRTLDAIIIYADMRQLGRIEGLRITHGDDDAMKIIDNLFDEVHPGRYEHYTLWLSQQENHKREYDWPYLGM